jgi:hypothetical protein
MSARSFVSLRPSASRDSYVRCARLVTGRPAANHLCVLSKADAEFHVSTRVLGNARSRLHCPRLVGCVLGRVEAPGDVSRPGGMFAESLCCGLMNQLRGEGWCGVVPHFRGCGGEINRLPRGYHAGDSAEVDWILRRLKKENPRTRLHVVGISMGGNDLLKWLGQQGDHALDVVHRVVAVSVPLDLQTDAKQLDHGWNKLIYTRDFLRTLNPKC